MHRVIANVVGNAAVAAVVSGSVAVFRLTNIFLSLFRAYHTICIHIFSEYSQPCNSNVSGSHDDDDGFLVNEQSSRRNNCAHASLCSLQCFFTVHHRPSSVKPFFISSHTNTHTHTAYLQTIASHFPLGHSNTAVESKNVLAFSEQKFGV